MSTTNEMIARYRQIRAAGIALNNRLVMRLGQDVIDEGARTLGLRRQNVIMMNTEDEAHVLVDFCIHDVRRDGLNAIEQFLRDVPPAAGSDEDLILQGLLRARFSIFAAESVERGVGVHVRDLVLDERVFLVDIGMSHSLSVGAGIAMRVFTADGITMTTGTGLPFGTPSPEVRAIIKENFVVRSEDAAREDPVEVSQRTGRALRMLLKFGAATNVRYLDPGQRPDDLAPPKLGRNSPCPCRSGRKFKQCCGAPK